MNSSWNPKDNYDMSASVFVVQFQGFMSLKVSLMLNTDINITETTYVVCLKSSVLIFYLIIYWTYLKLEVIYFEVWPLGRYTAVPSFLPLIIAVPEVIFRKCV